MIGRRRLQQPQSVSTMDFRAVVAVAAAALLVGVSAPAQGIIIPKVYRLHVLSEVRNRYAKTLISSRVGNPASEAQEISFDAVLPEKAYISRFVIEMDGVAYEAYVRGKEEARQQYDAARARGRGAAHVAVSARDSNVVHVFVNVEPQKKVNFNLTYEELLQREMGSYNLRININPRQIVEDLAVVVRIEEQTPLQFVEVPTLKESNEVLDYLDNSTDPLAHIERPSPTTATVRWAPTKEQQQQQRRRQRGNSGMSGELVVRYDVDREASPSQILVSEDGYFVHFYAPPGLSPLPKHVVFVLDVSFSMEGRKLEQLKTAMSTILDELNPCDVFSLIPFSNVVQVWHPDVPLTFEFSPRDILNPVFTSNAIVPATRKNIAKAKRTIKSFKVHGTTYMFSALKTALRVSKKRAASKRCGSAPGRLRRTPMLVLLTDGEPTGNVRNTEEIVRRITERNYKSKTAIFTLAFGRGADYGFLRRLALRNGGVGRRIYEAADAHLQLRNFYRQIASPLLADVTFKYDGQQVDEDSLTTVRFPTLFRGGELVVAGRCSSEMKRLWYDVSIRDGNTMEAKPEPAVVNVTSAERLWAYLTVQQLLDQDAATPNETIRTRAKDIALKYSFVTPVTSLVVVKPDATSAVNLEDAYVPPSKASLDQDLSLTALHASPQDYGRAAMLIPSPMPRRRPAPRPWLHTFDSHQADEAVENAHSPQAEEAVENDGRPTLADITWLGPMQNVSQVTLSIRGTRAPLQLALKQTEGSFQNCTTPGGGPGVCRHLASCVLRDFTESLDVFLSGWLCIVKGSFLGVCCPDHFSSVTSLRISGPTK